MPVEVFLPPVAPPLVTWGIGGLAALVAIGAVASLGMASRRSGLLTDRAVLLGAAAVVGWMGLTWGLAAAGVLARFDAVPPPAILVLGSVGLLGLSVALSPVGRALASLPWAWLVGFQAFRLPLELVMHEAAVAGVMPVQMSYSGRNPDILTGATALGVAGWLWLGGTDRRVLWAWNLLGLGLLVNIVAVAVASTPMFRAFGDDHLNTWVFFPPFVWLPTVLVMAALIGHVVMIRKLRGA